MPDCSNIQRSLEWCQGKPQYAGMRRRLYFTARSNIVIWPELPMNADGHPQSAIYAGMFTLKADAHWLYLDILPDKSQLTSEPQGEYPSQTQLNKLVAVHPGIELDATAAAAWFNNNETVFLVEDMSNNIRVVGNEHFPIKVTVSQDTGQGITGSANTTITVEASDVVPAPFYPLMGLEGQENGTFTLEASELTPDDLIKV